ncbi:MAG: plasmid stabilization protein [Bacteroidales bacterium 36-12]|nr:MAG: plasmid stabilization protein [Bacteroidales bacterium 36-12]
MANYELSNKAVEDLSKIYEYTFAFWSEFQAEKYYFELIEYCELLAENPNIGKNFEEIGAHIFKFPANKHIIFYKIINKQQIEILRILGADMDLKNRILE